MQNPLTMLSGKSRLQKHETPTPRNRGQKAVLRAAWGAHLRCVGRDTANEGRPTQASQGRPATPPRDSPEGPPGRAVQPSPGQHHSAWHFPNTRDRGNRPATPKASINILSSFPWKQSVKHERSDSLMNTGRSSENNTKISSVVTCGL